MLYVYLYHSLFVLIFYIGKYIVLLHSRGHNTNIYITNKFLIFIGCIRSQFYCLLIWVVGTYHTICSYVHNMFHAVSKSVAYTLRWDANKNPLCLVWCQVWSCAVVVTDDFVETLDTLPQLNNELRVGHFNMKASKAKGLARLLN